MFMKAITKMLNMPVSTKHTIEIARQLRGKKLSKAMVFLGGVIALKTPVPVKRYGRDTPHRKGIAAGRYPQKAAKEIFKGLLNVLNNANQQGMNPEKLVISTVEVGHAVSRNRRSARKTGKRTNMTLEVIESD